MIKLRHVLAIAYLFLLLSGGCHAEDRNYCAAFAVTDDGVFVTCAHLVRDYANLRLYSKGTYTAKILALDEVHDLALLKAFNRNFNDDQVTLTPVTGIPYLQISSSDQPALRDKVYYGSYPNFENPEYLVQTGTYDGLMKFGDLTLLDITGSFMYPSEGGPITDQNGKVIGVAKFVRSLGKGKKQVGAIPVEHLRALLKTAGIAQKASGSTPSSKIEEHIRTSLAFLQATTPTGADYGRDRVTLDYANPALSAQELTKFLNSHGRDSKCENDSVVLSFGDKYFNSISLLTYPYPRYSDFGQVPRSLVARTRLDLKANYRQPSKIAEVRQWADSLEMVFPGISIYVDNQNRLCLEQTLSLNNTLTWKELSAGIDSFQGTVRVIALGRGCDGFRKYLRGFEDWSGGLAG